MKRLIGSSKVIGAIAVLGIAAAVVSCGPSPFGLQSAAARTPVAQSSIGAPSGQVAPGAGQPAAAVPLASAARSSYAQTNPPIQVTSGVSQEPHGILVTGTGSASGQPDQAIVTTGVQTRAATAQDAQSQNNQTMQAVISAIKAQGISDKDIQTSGISLYPVIGQGNVVTGYNASNNVTVTIEKIDQAGAVLDAAVKAGANTAGNIRFELKDETALQNKALATAAADARSRANALAAALGVHVTGIQSISETSSSTPIPYRLAASQAAASSASVPVQPGQVTATAQVTILFSF